MTLEQIFLQEMLQNPFDDSPRLIFADWIEERGHDDRAAALRMADLPPGTVVGDPLEVGKQCSAQEAVLRTILRHPEDDALRLAYASQLDKYAPDGMKGQPVRDRADFIRLQVEAARLPEGSQSRQELEQQANAILTTNRTQWEHALRSIGVIEIDYDRGLPMITLLAHTFTDHGHELFKQEPSIIGARLADYCEPLEVASSPYLSKLTKLDLQGTGLTGHNMSVGEIVRSPYLSNLTHLSLMANRIGDGGAYAIAHSPHLRNLTHLNLASNNNISRRGIEWIASSPHLTNLTDLDLCGGFIGNSGIQAIASSPNMQHLIRLNLRANCVGEKGVNAIASSPYLYRLRELDLSGNDIHSQSAQALAEAIRKGKFPEIERMQLDNEYGIEHEQEQKVLDDAINEWRASAVHSTGFALKEGQRRQGDSGGRSPIHS